MLRKDTFSSTTLPLSVSGARVALSLPRERFLCFARPTKSKGIPFHVLSPPAMPHSKV